MRKLHFSFADGLQLLFIGLKLHGDIGWSWWSVLLPFEIEILLLFMTGRRGE